MFCSVLSAIFLFSINTLPRVNNVTDCVFDQLNDFRLNNPKKITMGQLNINSIPNKFNGIMDLVANKLDVFLISETKIDDSFPDAQFFYKNFGIPHRRDRKFGAGGLLMFINENIPSRKLDEHILPDDVEILCIEINLKKQKYCIVPSMKI